MKGPPPMRRAGRFLALLLIIGLQTERTTLADESVAAKMRSLFAKADADSSGVLSPQEQAWAIDLVKTTYGETWSAQIARMLTAAHGSEKTVTAQDWRKQVDAYTQSASAAPRTERLAMRDGVRLATDIRLPPGDGRVPTILVRTPYGRVSRGGEAAGFIRAGYACVIQDMRGRFDSEGDNLPFIGCGWGPQQDGVDTVAWIRGQPWSDGRVATIGGSAAGITQNLLAGAAPEGLVAQYISVAPADIYTDISYTGCALRQADVENWLRGNKFAAAALKNILDHPSYDDHWRATDTHTRFAVMNVPAVHIGGWFDMFAQGTIEEFRGRQHRGAAGSKGRQKLIMGPWTHGIGKMPAGQLTFPGADRPPATYDASRWFDHHLRGIDNGIDREPAVAYYVMGDTSRPGAPGNHWRFADDWPIPARDTPFHLTADKRLGRTPPAAGAGHHEFTFDPAAPCPTVGGNNLTIDRGPMDQRRIEDRSDVVVFTTDPLAEPVEVTGRVLAKLFVSSSAVDTDLSVRLCDVYPDGRSMLIAEGMQRLRYRNSRERPEPLVPGRTEEVTIDCWSTSIVFDAGHRIRVTVTSSNHPRFDVNPGTGRPWRSGDEMVKQTNRILCDAAHPSRVILPIPTNHGAGTAHE